ncbi:MAG: hypothetical protein QXM08_00390 [Thermofilaceae archaeon]
MSPGVHGYAPVDIAPGRGKESPRTGPPREPWVSGGVTHVAAVSPGDKRKLRRLGGSVEYRVRVGTFEFVVPDERLAKGIKELWEFEDLFEEPEDLVGLIEMHLCEDEHYECTERTECGDECKKCEEEVERICKNDPDSDECAEITGECDEICEKTCVDIVEVKPRGKRRARA